MSETNNNGLIESDVGGKYDFSIRAVISEAWDKTSGAKWPINLAFIYYFLVIIGLALIIGVASAALSMGTGGLDTAMPSLLDIFLQIALTAIMLPMMMGITMMGIHRAVDRPINANSVFGYFSKTFNLFLTMILMYIMIIIGYILLILPGIYLTVAYYMALPLIVEKNMSPWQALETSRKAVSKRWFRMFFFFLAIGIITFISMIPLGIGLIWSVPLFMIAYGIIYRNMFGVEEAPAE